MQLVHRGSTVRVRRTIAVLVATLLVAAVASPAAAASKLVIHAFAGGPTDGAMPVAPLISARDGFLYGTTPSGGTADLGSVFRMDLSGRTTLLHSFDRCDRAGYAPRAALFEASDGRIYGTTSKGGVGNACTQSLDTRNGTIFRLEPSGALTTLFTFSAIGQGRNPSALAQGADGALYGTTSAGGTTSQTYPLGRGTIFRISPTAPFAFQQLHRFAGADGMRPLAPLALGRDGLLYGSTHTVSSTAGTFGGSLFRISATRPLETLFVFRNRADGTSVGGGPRGRLVQTGDGRWYGTTEGGGPYGYGTVYRFDAATRIHTVLHAFGFDGGYATTGKNPLDGLVLMPSGVMYGTARLGGLPVDPDRDGVIFRVTQAGRVGVVHTFRTMVGGVQPSTTLTRGIDGRLYGTAYGGSGGLGLVYRYTHGATPILSSVSTLDPEVWSGEAGFGSTTGYVILDGGAPSTGADVKLTSSDPAALQVPATVRVDAGWSTVSFRLTSTRVTTDRTVTITAEYGGQRRTTTIAVYAGG